MSSPSTAPRRAPLWLVPAGFVIGFLGSLCGIGGGLFAVPILHYLRKIPLKEAVATALVLVLATTGASTATELFQAQPDLHGWPILGLVAGVLAGAQLGYLVAVRVNVRLLRAIFVVFLSVAGYRVLAGGGEELAESAPVVIGAFDVFLAFLVGIGGGFVAPLLGVGGGLVMVPGLYLILPAMGFPGARACSLAAAVVGSSRSLFLHARAGRVHRSPGLLLGAGALGGAVAGVNFLHLPDFAEVGRPILALVLWFVAARFLVDLVRGGKDSEH